MNGWFIQFNDWIHCRLHTGYYLRLVILAVAGFFPLAYGAPMTADYVAIPPFVAENTGKPNVIIALDISGSMKEPAYEDVGAGNWKTGLHDDFNAAVAYFGYFDSAKKYSYNYNYGFFVESGAGDWDGNFLNWLSMRRMDVVRKVLVGGKVRDRNGENFGGTTYYVLQGQNEPYDYSFRKSYSGSGAHTPYPDGQEFTIADGQIKPTTSANTASVALDSTMEIGRVTMDWAVGDAWQEVEFKNNYVNPIVVAHSVSYNGADPVVARVKDVGAAIGPNGGFRLRIQEWDYKDHNHTTEDVIYLVAESGSHSIALDGGGTLDFVAGKVLTNKVVGAVNTSFTPVAFSALPAKPAVFAGVSTYNESDQEAQVVTVRLQNISSAGFEVAMQEQELNAETHVNEYIHYIAAVPVSGTVSASGVPVEIGTTGTVMDDHWNTINFATTFPSPPMVAMNMQTFNGFNTASLRYGNAVHTASAVDVKVEEEQSSDSETTHTPEDVAYFAAPGSGINIVVGLTAEPTGIIQDNAAGMRFGLAVYNYDHTKSPSAIYVGNTVDGGTLFPCYPDTAKPLSLRTNYDICLETHVKAPIENIITVIEDHPLIWGTTPIAETLYEIYGYVAQLNNARNGHAYFYNNGTETDFPPAGTPSYPSYKINNDWDPYYYAEFGGKMKCAKTFVLHFNDGAPYNDWDNTNPSTIASSAISDGVGATGPQEMLDDVAHALRKNDCRSDLTEHQEIISYYVYAALDEKEINNDSTRKMREAAANGGFVDDNKNHLPDPAHPADFISYYDTFLNGGTCTVNEWDDNGDCNPDTFYLVNDGYKLVSELNAAFDSILRRASSGGAASVISASSSGEGAIFQAIFHTTQSNGGYDVKWTGDVHGLFIDSSGLLREDDGDKTLEDPGNDQIIDMCFDPGEQTVRVKLSSSEGDRPSESQAASCSVSTFNKTLFDVNYLWSGGEWLNSLTDVQATTQRSYTSNAKGRYIITGIDANGDGLIGPAEVNDFSALTFTGTNAGLLQAADTTQAAAIVDYIRGEDQAGFRSREYDNGKTWRLGDVVYSTPTPYGRPAENLHLLYFDNPTVKAEYTQYKTAYNERRQVIYAGSNDGMLHAFNGGWYDAANKTYHNAPSGKTGYDLGAELWAYIPYNFLPHLKYLADPSYGATTGNHIYGVDLQPRIFDAKIFSADADHPNGWGTVLVGGMRFGGGTITVDADTGAGTDIRTLRSSFFILDITNPEAPPKLLLEFTHPNLGFTTSTPAPFIYDGKFYLLFGSGPDNSKSGLQAAQSTQAAHLFLLNLHTMALEPSFGASGVLTLAEPASFISDIASFDYGLDYNVNGIYFGTVSGSGAPWSGKLYRIKTQNDDDTLLPISSWSPSVLLDANLPIVAKPAGSFDELGNRWIFVGTGRYLTRFDATDTAQQKFFGVKEPRNTSGDFSWSGAVISGLVDVTNAEVESVTGELSGVSLAGLPATPTFFDLAKRMSQFDSDYVDGWYRDLPPAGNRVIGEATVFGGTLNHTAYKPSAATCTVDGESQLYVVYYTTGTASAIPIIGAKTSNGANGHPLVQTLIDIGSTPALTPSLHTGKGYSSDRDSKAFVQTSDGKVIGVDQSNNDAVRSGEGSWRIYQ